MTRKSGSEHQRRANLVHFSCAFGSNTNMDQKAPVSQQITESWGGWAEAIKTSRDEESTNKHGVRRFGLEMQCPYAEHLLSGRKSIETRGYALPTPLLTKVDCDSDGCAKEVRIDILESKRGQDGVSAIPDRVSVLTIYDCHNDGLKIEASSTPFLVRKGWCTFSYSFRYTTREQFEADERKHLVTSHSGYGWNDKRPIYGWVVGTSGVYDSDDKDCKLIAERRMRSLFEIHD
ncbi:hypothetical protein ACHAW6_005632 [Cyclotella cf. meneghiniana]